MKNMKFGVFALLGVLSISGIALGIATGEGSFLTNVEANETGNCALTWNKQNAPEIGGQKELTDTASTVTLSYKNVVESPTGHIRLTDGGYVKTANTPYDSALGIGGYCNGITSITVNFKENGSTGIGCVQHLDLNVTFGNIVSHKYSTSEDANNILVSGQKITFVDAPRSFELKYTGYESTGDDAGGWLAYNTRNTAASNYTCDIQSIVVECTMDAQYTGNVTTEYNIGATASDFSVYKADNQMEARLAKITSLKNERLTYGQILAFAPNEECTKTIAAEDLTITGGQLVKTAVLQGTKQPTFFINVTGDLNIKVNSVRNRALYEGEAFVGSYYLYKLKDETTCKATLSADGKFTFADRAPIDYEYKNGSFTLSGYKIKYLDHFIHIVDNSDSYARLIGMYDLGEAVTFECQAGIGDNRYIDIHIGSNGLRSIYVKTDYIVPEMYQGAGFSTGKGFIRGSLVDYDGYVLCISAPIVDGKSALSDFAPIDGRMTEGDMDYVQVDIGDGPGQPIVPIVRNSYHGTYKSADQSITLVYDGYNHATINGGQPLVATIKNKVLTVAGADYELNTNNMTVTKLVKDPLNTPQQIVYEATIDGTSKTFTFSNGKVNTNLLSESAVKYSFKQDFTYKITYDDYNYGLYCTFTLKLSEDYTTLTVTEDAYWRWLDDDTTYGNLIVGAGTVFKLV